MINAQYMKKLLSIQIYIQKINPGKFFNSQLLEWYGSYIYMYNFYIIVLLDPFHRSEYLENCIFLPKLNNCSYDNGKLNLQLLCTNWHIHYRLQHK